MISNNDIHLAE